MISICDTGPLVAYLDRREPHHPWAANLFTQVLAPMLTCEAVIAETSYFLREGGVDVELLFEMIERGSLTIDFNLSQHWQRVRTLMGRYQQMDLADACVVAMSEAHRRCQVLTLDAKDFSVYRRNDRQVIEFVSPPSMRR